MVLSKQGKYSMQGLPSTEELRTGLIDFMEDWGKDFNFYEQCGLITSRAGNWMVVRDGSQQVEFSAVLDAINILKSCSLTYTTEKNEVENLLYVYITLSYNPLSVIAGLVNASKVYTSLEDYVDRIMSVIRAGLWEKFPSHCVPVLVDPRLENTITEDPVGKQPAQTDKYKTWNNLCFRSETEIRIARAFDKVQGVLFLPNAQARLGHPRGRENREPDFLVCYRGKWGILEVDGQKYHPSAAKDHARDRLFKLHGISVVEHFDATDCYENPEHVVKQFLYLLSRLAT
jgi:hypothetical protein